MSKLGIKDSEKIHSRVRMHHHPFIMVHLVIQAGAQIFYSAFIGFRFTDQIQHRSPVILPLYWLDNINGRTRF